MIESKLVTCYTATLSEATSNVQKNKKIEAYKLRNITSTFRGIRNLCSRTYHGGSASDTPLRKILSQILTQTLVSVILLVFLRYIGQAPDIEIDIIRRE